MRKTIPLLKTLRDRRGFTLVEVLVSSALTLIVLGMLFMVLIGAMNAWEGGTSRLQTNADARLALDLIARDLQSMVVRQTTYNQQWLVSASRPIPGAPSELRSTWLAFFAPSVDRDTGQEGDIVALSYMVGVQDPLSASSDPNEFVPMYGLYKTMIDTTNTFAHALGQSNIVNNFWWTTLPIPRANGNVPVNQLPLEKMGLICPNVVDFKVTWWMRDTVTDQLGAIRPTSTMFLGNVLSYDAADRPTKKLEAADISLTILTEEGARIARLGTMTAARLREIIQEHGRTHTQRVVISY